MERADVSGVAGGEQGGRNVLADDAGSRNACRLKAVLSHDRIDMMKIAFVTTSLGMGGAENQVVALADRLAALGHTVLIISLTGDPVLLPQHAAVSVEALNMARNPLSFAIAYRRARRLLATFKPDVVHSHMVHANLFARLLRMAAPMPRLICTAHNTNEGGTVRMLAYRLTDRLADITTNVSEEAVKCFIERNAVQAHRIMAVHNGIDCERFAFDAEARTRLRTELGVQESTQVLLAVGRFSEQKDYANLFAAFAAVAAARSDCVLWIAGAGGQQSQYEQRAKEMGIADRVGFLGLRRDIPSLMSAADIFVLSSAWEGLPLVIGEAMACERIVVSTDAGGIGEWLGDTGYVVPTRNSAALSKALLQAIDMHAEARLAQGFAARERVLQRYSLATIVSRWLAIYQGRYGM